jgi:ArsR family transcriptional regulator, lead/cadmium/zinc/bismuth-responsive transcriptional repressor
MMNDPVTADPVTAAPVTAIDPQAVAAAASSIPPAEILSLVVETFDALADPTRARLLYALSRQTLCVRDLAILAGVSESAISHQLHFLRERRLVSARRQGNAIYYATDDHHVAALFREAEYHADHVRRGMPDHPYPANADNLPGDGMTGGQA